jgi:hypothetical protein
MYAPQQVTEQEHQTTPLLAAYSAQDTVQAEQQQAT